MKPKTMVSVLVLLVSLSIIGAGYYLLSVQKRNQGATTKAIVDDVFGWKYPVTKFPKTGPAGQLSYSDIRDPGGLPQGLPVRLKIPIIGVDSAIEDAFITPDGRMDVPAGSINVAWFSLGPHPGQIGSAVIGGHFGITNGVPFVFYDLEKLKVGDKIYIVDDKGDTLAFVVSSIKLFHRDADATSVFTSDDGLAHLNLITCEGIWNRVNDTYPERRVVFTDAIPSEGAVLVKPALPILNTANTITTPTPIVSEPLTIPPSVLAARLSPQLFMTIVKSSYKTPIDGFITSFLLISIVIVAYNIIKRSVYT